MFCHGSSISRSQRVKQLICCSLVEQQNYRTVTPQNFNQAIYGNYVENDCFTEVVNLVQLK